MEQWSSLEVTFGRGKIAEPNEMLLVLGCRDYRCGFGASPSFLPFSYLGFELGL